MATPETAPPADLTSLAHAIGRLEGSVNALWEGQRALAEGQRALADEVRAFGERQQSMAEDIRALAEGQRVLAEGQRALADCQNVLEAEMRSAFGEVNSRIDRVLQVGIVSGATVPAAIIGAIVAVALIG